MSNSLNDNLKQMKFSQPTENKKILTFSSDSTAWLCAPEALEINTILFCN